MTFHDWVIKTAREKDRTMTQVLEDVSARTEISMTTLKACYNGAKMNLYQKAKLLSIATQESVSIAELCE